MLPEDLLIKSSNDNYILPNAGLWDGYSFEVEITKKMPVGASALLDLPKYKSLVRYFSKYTPDELISFGITVLADAVRDEDRVLASSFYELKQSMQK